MWEPSVDNMPQTPVNSIIMQKMLDEQVQWDTFKPPLHNLSQEIKQSLNKLLETFKSQFAGDETSMGTTHLTKMQIGTGTSEPVSQRLYPIAMKYYDWVKKKINKPFDVKVICSSHSSWSALIIIVPKGDGGKHLVIDYKALNKINQKLIWSMPKVRHFSKLNGAQYFSTLNLWARYHIPLNYNSIPVIPFTLPFGKCEYLKVPFGLAQEPAYFQELVNKVLKNLPFAISCLDNIVINSKTAEHLHHLLQVFTNFAMQKYPWN